VSGSDNLTVVGGKAENQGVQGGDMQGWRPG
jgi:hypothetical protein